MKNSITKFKAYHQNQLMVLPPSFDELIEPTHPVRVVNQIIDEINLDPLLKKYKGGGCTSYHPRMLLKVLIYGYLCNLYSSRKIESATKENINFMWLAGMQKPDHNTINRFRTDRLKGIVKKVFTQVVLLMSESGHVELQSAYTDGTKIESQGNRYTFVWGKRIKTSKENISKQLEELWEYTQSVAKQELSDTIPANFEKLDPEKVKETIEKIDQALKDKPIDKKTKQKINYAKKNWADKLKQYQQQEEILGERNSYSKTDKDATFMRMKEDHMKNGQLKPGYNAQISTNNQIIIHYTIHQNPTDTKTLKPHLKSFKHYYGFLPKELTADAGYGSEENYEYLEKNDVEAFVKYNHFDREQNKKDESKPVFNVDNLYYNKEDNCYFCPMGQKMSFIGLRKETNNEGYEKTIYRYQAINCDGCPLRGQCHKSKTNRIIEVSHRLNELKSKARERLLSEKGIVHRKQRSIDVEPVFGILKQNKGFRRFLLKGLVNVDIEFGLLALAHNLKKLATKLELKSFFVSFLELFKLLRRDIGFVVNFFQAEYFLLRI